MTQQICGGAAIGVSVAALMALTGKILGISGILSGIVNPLCDDRVCRLLFLGGLVAGGELVYQTYPVAFANSLSRPLWCFALGGFLVGIGTNVRFLYLFHSPPPPSLSLASSRLCIHRIEFQSRRG